MRHERRYSTRRVRRLRRMVMAYRCSRCKAWDWEDMGEQQVAMDAFRRAWLCRRCGNMDW